MTLPMGTVALLCSVMCPAVKPALPISAAAALEFRPTTSGTGIVVEPESGGIDRAGAAVTRSTAAAGNKQPALSPDLVQGA